MPLMPLRNWLKKNSFFNTLFPRNTVRRYICWQIQNIFFPSAPAESSTAVLAPDHAEYMLTISRRAGFELPSGARILDFGCGSGTVVCGLLAKGLDAYGYDIFDWLDNESKGLPERFSFFPHPNTYSGTMTIDWNEFSLPYPDNYFDAIFSNQVFEHVMSHEPMFKEFSRVMKPEGFSVNIFPPRWYPYECHMGVPFGYTLQFKPYYFVMASLGFCDEKNKKDRLIDIANSYYNCAEVGLNYRPNKELIQLAQKYFSNVVIDQKALLDLKTSPSFLQNWYFSNFVANICLVMSRKSLSSKEVTTFQVS